MGARWPALATATAPSGVMPAHRRVTKPPSYATLICRFSPASNAPGLRFSAGKRAERTYGDRAGSSPRGGPYRSHRRQRSASGHRPAQAPGRNHRPLPPQGCRDSCVEGLTLTASSIAAVIPFLINKDQDASKKKRHLRTAEHATFAAPLRFHSFGSGIALRKARQP